MNAIVGDKAMGEIMNVTEYEPTFHIWRFFKIFMYHVGFFAFGILMTLIIVIVDGYQFACNMAFIGTRNIIILIIQYMPHLAFTSSITLINFVFSSLSNFHCLLFSW